MKKFILTLVLLVLIDSAYLYVMGPIVAKHIRMIQGSTMSINMYGAALAYICLAISLTYFITNNSVTDAFVLGVLIYGVYEGTNWATFRQWPAFVVIMDTLWGGTLFAITIYILKYLV
jgi:uncharacterized membrane protein